MRGLLAKEEMPRVSRLGGVWWGGLTLSGRYFSAEPYLAEAIVTVSMVSGPIASSWPFVWLPFW
jgi:hypothetical protein